MKIRRLAAGAGILLLTATVSGSSPCIDTDLLAVYRDARLVFVGKVVKRELVSAAGLPASGEQAVRAAYTVKVLPPSIDSCASKTLADAAAALEKLRQASAAERRP